MNIDLKRAIHPSASAEPQLLLEPEILTIRPYDDYQACACVAACRLNLESRPDRSTLCADRLGQTACTRTGHADRYTATEEDEVRGS